MAVPLGMMLRTLPPMQKVRLLDVRTMEYQREVIWTAFGISSRRSAGAFDELDWVFHLWNCQTGLRSYLAC